jgi:hypothetical protein
MTEFHVRKVRVTETGGRPTPLEDPYLMIMNLAHTGFISWAQRQPLFQNIHFDEKKKQQPINLNFLSQGT